MVGVEVLNVEEVVEGKGVVVEEEEEEEEGGAGGFGGCGEVRGVVLGEMVVGGCGRGGRCRGC